MKNYFSLFVLLFLSLTFTENTLAKNYFCQQELESLPIQQGGRVKPLYVHASEAIKQLTGKSKIGEFGALEAYCLLSSRALGIPNELKVMARIDHVEVQKFLGLSADQHEVAYDDLIGRLDEIRLAFMRIKENNSYKKSLTALFNSIHLYQEITNGENWLLAEVN
ncbi:MAG: hypothetical protein L6Q33_11025, partial [Bacteriovoracaceae bacterium]|nr:hypothetical protein [Bacteriovoracaceae bacterium]